MSVFTLGLNIDSVSSEELLVTDHDCILLNFSFKSDRLTGKHVKFSCMLNNLSAEKFSSFCDSRVVLHLSHDNADVNDLVHSFNSHCSVILDKVAPLKTHTVNIVNLSP